MSKLKNKLLGIFQKKQDIFIPSQLMDAGCTPELIASGSVGKVYKVIKNGYPAAVKVIECSTEAQLAQAQRECELMKRLFGNPYAVPLLDSVIVSHKNGHTAYLLQNYCTSFETYYQTNRMTTNDIIRLGMDICEGLIACRNKGFLYLDVQPKNLFVSELGRFQLGDFSSSLPMDLLENLSSPVGTMNYMAPEVYHEHRCSQASEIYALGVLLYTLCSGGNLPFSDRMDSEAAVLHRLSGAVLPPLQTDNAKLNQCIATACAPSPFMRYQTPEDMVSDLKDALTSVTSTGFAAPTCPSPGFYPQPTAATPPPPMFHADSFASTCAPPIFDADFSAAAPSIFRADSFATSCALPSMFSADSFATTCALPSTFDTPPLTAPCAPISMPPKTPTLSKVQFSAVAPKTALKGEYTLIQLYMYEEFYRSVVDQALAEGEGPMQEKKTSFFSVAAGTRVKVVLSSPDIDLIEDEAEQFWDGEYLVFDFALELPLDFPKKQILIKANIYFDDMPATRLLLTLKTQSVQNQRLEMQRQDVLNAFVSYAREDQARVGAMVQGMRKARPDMDIFFDIAGLRSGEDWEARLQQRLELCDTLFLCWSRAASNSPWVNREWRFVLASKGLDAIEPIPIEPPDICPPPPELNKKYFNDAMLYLIRPPETW